MLISLRKAFFSGIILLAPIGVTYFVFNSLVLKIGGTFRGKLLFFVPQTWIEQENLQMFWNVVATICVLILITLLGYLSRYVVARYLFTIGERILRNVPLVNTVYTSVKQIVDTFSSENRAVFQKVALIQFPQPGNYAIGFLTGTTKGEPQVKTDSNLLNIFVPTTPNPTSGFLIMLPESSVQILDMTVGEGMKLIISGGAVAPPFPRGTTIKESPIESNAAK